MNPRAEPSPHSASAPAARSWTTLRDEKARRLAAIAPWLEDGVLPAARIVDALETLIRPGDRVALEGDNQKQADFLSRSFAKVDPQKIHDVHLLISSISRPEHLTLFERGITRKVDFAFAGAQSLRVAQLLEDDQLEIGAIYTYVELYARMFVDLTPNVALLCADKADRHGNLYTGPNTEDTPTIAEAAAFRHGIVIVQVNEIVDELPRVDIPGSWVDVVVQADRPFAVEPLFTRDPRHIGDLQVLTAMMVIRGIYEAYGVTSLNHGIGFDTAAIELLLPTYGEALGLKGKICRNWTLNPHPTLIPAIESGWVESVHSFGSEVGMEQYIEARPDVSLPEATAACVRTACCASWPGNTVWTCSSVRRCRSTRMRIRRQSHAGGSPASAVRRTWATIRADAVIRAKRGSSY
jgi:malonate decarboxylase alpha subunit